MTGPTISITGPTSGTDETVAWTVGLVDADDATCTVDDGDPLPCQDGDVVTGSRSSDGVTTLTVVAVDALGNESTATADYERTTTPVAPSVSVAPAGPSRDVAPVWTVTADAELVECTLTSGSSSVPVDCSTGTAAGLDVDDALTADGRWTFEVRASNPSTGSAVVTAGAQYVLDRSEPAGPTLVPTHVGSGGNATDLEWSWTSAPATADEAARSTECRRTEDGVVGDWEPGCTSPQAFAPSGPGTGQYALEVRYADEATNTGTPSSASYDYDGAAPAAPTVTRSPAGDPVAAGVLRWTVEAAGDAGDTDRLECRLAAGDSAAAAGQAWVLCGATFVRTVSDGDWTFQARALDVAGNASAAAQDAFTADGVPPGQPGVSSTQGPRTADPALVWTVTPGTDATGVQCRLLPSLTWDACAASYTVQDDGTYTLEARSVDAVGNVSAAKAGPALTVDREGPAAPGVALDDRAGREASAGWVVTPAEAGRVECLVEHRASATAPWVAVGDWGACTSPTTALTAGEGEHRLLARSYDDLDNEGDVATGPTYLLDQTPPAQPAVSSALDGTTGSARPVRYDVAGVPADATGSACVVQRVAADGTATDVQLLGDCRTGADVVLPTTDGDYRLSVVLRDEHGNESEPATSGLYRLDRTPPGRPVVTGELDGRTGSDRTWSYGFTSQEGVATCVLRQDGTEVQRWSPCTSPRSVAPADSPASSGTWTLEVSFVDGARNTGPTGVSGDYVLDLTPPATPSVTITPAAGSSRTVHWDVDPLEAGATAVCRLRYTPPTGAEVVPTLSPCAPGDDVVLDSGDGSYALDVRLTDRYGNPGPLVQGDPYLLDTAGPAAPTVVGDRDGTVGADVAVGFDVTDLPADADSAQCILQRVERGPDGVLVVLQTVDLGSCGARVDTDLPSVDGEWRLQVVLLDEHGNAGEPAVSGTYLLDLTDPDQPDVTGAFDGTTGSGRSYAYSFTLEEGTPTCVLYRDGVEDARTPGCASPFGVVLPADPAASGTWHLEVFFTDEAGNQGLAGRSGDYELDLLPPDDPAVTVTPRAGNALRATWTVSPVEPSAAVACRLRYTPPTGPEVVPATFGTCAADFAYDLTQGDGLYALEVQLTDRYGNAGDPVLGQTYLLDTEGPAAPTVTGDRDGQLDHELTVRYALTDVPADATAAQCTLQTVAEDGTASTVRSVGDCLPGATVVLPSTNGTYRLQVVLLDRFGNPGDAAVSGGYDLDVVDPDQPEVVGELDGETDNVLTVAYAFSAEEGTATCVLLREGLAQETTPGCTSPFTVTLPDDEAASGSWHLEVSYTDDAGNTGLAGRSGDYDLDLVPPGDPGVTVTPRTDDVESATWTVTPQEDGTTSTCRLRYTDLDGVETVSASADCAAPYAFDLTSGDGSYALEVLLTDAVGNPGTAVVGEDYLLDTTAPETPEPLGPTAASNDTTVSWTWTVEPAATSACALYRTVGGATTDVTPAGMPCAPGATVTLPSTSGDYAFEVVVTDAVGNPSEPGRSRAYPLDVTPPVPPTPVTAAATPNKERSVTWTFAARGRRHLPGGGPHGHGPVHVHARRRHRRSVHQPAHRAAAEHLRDVPAGGRRHRRRRQRQRGRPQRRVRAGRHPADHPGAVRAARHGQPPDRHLDLPRRGHRHLPAAAEGGRVRRARRLRPELRPDADQRRRVAAGRRAARRRRQRQRARHERGVPARHRPAAGPRRVAADPGRPVPAAHPLLDLHRRGGGPARVPAGARRHPGGRLGQLQRRLRRRPGRAARRRLRAAGPGHRRGRQRQPDRLLAERVRAGHHGPGACGRDRSERAVAGPHATFHVDRRGRHHRDLPARAGRRPVRRSRPVLLRLHTDADRGRHLDRHGRAHRRGAQRERAGRQRRLPARHDPAARAGCRPAGEPGPRPGPDLGRQRRGRCPPGVPAHPARRDRPLVDAVPVAAGHPADRAAGRAVRARGPRDRRRRQRLGDRAAARTSWTPRPGRRRRHPPAGPGPAPARPSYSFTTEAGASTRCRTTSGATVLSDFVPHAPAPRPGSTSPASPTAPTPCPSACWTPRATPGPRSNRDLRARHHGPRRPGDNHWSRARPTPRGARSGCQRRGRCRRSAAR